MDDNFHAIPGILRRYPKPEKSASIPDRIAQINEHTLQKIELDKSNNDPSKAKNMEMIAITIAYLVKIYFIMPTCAVV